jgi:hypothetical protein
MAGTMQLRVSSLPSQALAFTNNVYVPTEIFQALRVHSSSNDEEVNAYGLMISVSGIIFCGRPLKNAEEGGIAMNALQRRTASLAQNQMVTVSIFSPTSLEFVLSSINLEVDVLANKKSTQPIPVDCPALTRSALETFCYQPFQIGQVFTIDFGGKNLSCKVVSMTPVAATTPGGPTARITVGQLVRVTEIVWAKATGSTLQLQGQESG